MANADTRFGLKPAGHLMGINWSGGVREFQIASAYGTALYIGEAVDLAGSADTAAAAPTIAKVTAGATNVIMGAIVGLRPNPDALGQPYWAASDTPARYASVVCDPFVIFEIQACSGAAIGAASVGLNAVLIDTHAGDTITSLAGTEMDSGTTTAPAANATYQLLILGAVNRSDNDISVVNAKWHVLVSLHRFNSVWQVDTGGSAAQAGLKGV